jgi:chitinase
MIRLWLTLLTFVVLPLTLSATSLQRSKPEVIAYVFPKDRVIQPGEIAAQKLTRINYAFANIQNGRIVEGFASDAQNLAVLQGLKGHNPDLKVLVSVGGWLWSGNFSDMALTRESRRVFVDSVVEFVRKYQLDGLDIDWEYPGGIGAGNRFRPEDKQNYTALMKELRRRFDREQKQLHRRLYLSVAAGASTEFVNNTELSKVQKYVDSVNLMAYDYYEPGSDAITGHHAPLFTNPADPKKISADRSVREFEEAGVPASKIVLGVPFYGHAWGNVADREHGLYQPGKAIPNTLTRYNDITNILLKQGFVRYWDPVAAVPYLYNPAMQVFVSYEDAESLTGKSRYVREHKLGGVMFWEYTADSSGVLLDAINAGLERSAGR